MKATGAQGAADYPDPSSRSRTGQPVIHWLEAPEPQHLEAARSYLSFLASPDRVDALMAELRTAANDRYKAKDILRACGLTPVGTDDRHVARDLARVAAGEPLSPVLMVRGDFANGSPATLADGYHRISAAWHLDPDMDVLCRIAGRGAVSIVHEQQAQAGPSRD